MPTRRGFLGWGVGIGLGVLAHHKPGHAHHKPGHGTTTTTTSTSTTTTTTALAPTTTTLLTSGADIYVDLYGDAA